MLEFDGIVKSNHKTEFVVDGRSVWLHLITPSSWPRQFPNFVCFCALSDKAVLE